MRVGLADLVDDAVLGIGAVLGVDVVVAGQPQVAAGAGLPAGVARGRPGLRGGLTRADAAERPAGGQPGAEQTGTAYQGAPGELLGRQFPVGDGQVEGRRDRLGGGRLVTVPVPVGVSVSVAVRVGVVVSVAHVVSSR